MTSAEGKRTERFSENHCEEGGETEYLVRWKGYDESHDEWKKEPEITRVALDEYREHLKRAEPAMPLPSHRATSSHAANFFKQSAKDNANRGGCVGSSNKSSENAQMERCKHVASKPQKTSRAGK